MAKVNKQAFLQQLIDENKQMLATIENQFAPLHTSILEKQPTPNKWSVIQCLQHIVITENIYFDQIRKIQGKITACEKTEFKSGWLGSYFSKMMYPHNQEIKNNMGTAKYMDPLKELDSNANTAEILEQIVHLKKDVIAFLEDCKTLNIEKNKIQSAIPLLKFKLGNALQFLTAHSLRHVVQAEKVLQKINTK